ncbi:hypothetical protein KRP22_005207 [Phytophthora ramorum]|nr:hypothetical protein KRP22_12791 [Phytophthora ramorum]
MTVFIALLVFVAVAAVSFAVRGWLSGRLKDNTKKQDDVQADSVEIVVQKPAYERRLKLALPDLSYVQIRSPVGPMKSSIRSALKELRSRQMVQNLCSRFETRVKVNESEDSVKKAGKKTSETRGRRRDASVAPVLSTSGLASGLAREAEITENARSNNLNKFLRSYASNLDNAISAERRVVMSTDAISAERSIVMSTDAEDDVEQPLLADTEEIALPLSETIVDNEDASMELELDLHTLQLESEYSNQVDSPATAESEEDLSVLVEATDCDPLLDESFGESDEGNNNVRSSVDTSSRLSEAFTQADMDDESAKQAAPETARRNDSKPELCIPPALTRFKQQVPSNGRRARSIATLNI